ncbi:MAG TPA: flagellar hook protein FlgE [Candidatus Hydrogenedentes bacterium]|nr:flagellar hook protein FlgE [Candidatus Hydrogenedentota bacterium]HNT87359.1 flagellar hook protein FlgE [Candidatus Hydrogenedentota bacterium]
MGTAIYTGVNGLLVQQRKLDVVASNIANVNTTGYRGARVLFQDLFSQTLAGGSAPVGNFGGTNPLQVGLGVQIASIDTNFEQGSLITTGVSSDLAIQGAGFFILSDGLNDRYSRDGSFRINANGVLVDPATGLRVRGFMANEQGVIDTNAAPTDITIPVGATGIVRATENATLIGNLNADVAAGTTVTRSITVYDSLGTAREVSLLFTKTANTNEWSWEATFNGVTVSPVPAGTITFSPDGTLVDDPLTPQDETLGLISIPVAAFPTDTALPATPFEFAIHFGALTQLSMGADANSDVTLRNQDGFPRGVLQSFNIGGNGEINGVFTNGLTKVIAQVALATFANVSGLERDGNNLFRETPASGTAQVGGPQSGGRGSVSGGVLENSNVDLGAEFSNLIITQRGFQANARTISAADTLLQETVNLGR